MGDWVIALAIFLATLTLLPIVKGYVSNRRRKWLQSQRELPVAIQVAALFIERTSLVFLWTIALYLASIRLEFPANVNRVIEWAIVLTFWYQLGRWAMAAVRFAIDRRSQRTGGPDPALSGSLDIIMFIAGLAIWSMAMLLALDNLGVEIKPLLAGLGIGGIAVALAVQTVLGDLLASMSIALDKPFTSRRFAAGRRHQRHSRAHRRQEHPAAQRIGRAGHHFERGYSQEPRAQQRADARTALRVRSQRTYGTEPDKLRAIPPAVREIVETQPRARFDRCHLLTFADWALRFEVVFYMTVPDYQAYADVQQAINLAIVEKFATAGRRLRAADPAVARAFNLRRRRPAVSRSVRRLPMSCLTWLIPLACRYAAMPLLIFRQIIGS